MKVWICVILIASCVPPEPLEPGETRCATHIGATSSIFGTNGTLDCKSRPYEDQPAAPSTDAEQIYDIEDESPLAKQARAERMMAHRKIINGDGPMFCTVNAKHSGLCFLTEQDCINMRIELGDAFAACVQRIGASCFNATDTINQLNDMFCAPTITDCEAKRTLVSNNLDYTKVSPQCVIYRQRKSD